jgi:hypothetical protein
MRWRLKMLSWASKYRRNPQVKWQKSTDCWAAVIDWIRFATQEPSSKVLSDWGNIYRSIQF